MALSAERRAEMARKGAVEVDVQTWLGLSDIEMQLIEVRVRLAREVRRRREEAGLTQRDLAGRIGSTQPRIVQLEGNGSGVSLDRLVSAFLATGATLADLASLIDHASTAITSI